MEKIEFKDSMELYERVKPALNSKLKELEREGLTVIKAEDIWNFLIKSKWISAKDLVLSDVVNDILNIDNKKLEEYIEDKMKSRRVSVAKDKLDII